MGDQRDWVELQAQMLRTLRERGVTVPQGQLSEQEADFLADHLADDVYAMFDLTPRHQGVGSSRGLKRRRLWHRLRRKRRASGPP